jgi:hypothetical protein
MAVLLPTFRDKQGAINISLCCSVAGSQHTKSHLGLSLEECISSLVDVSCVDVYPDVCILKQLQALL